MYVISFEKLNIWKEAIRLSKDVYQITGTFPSDEKFGLTGRVRRATNSIAANIAEGGSRIRIKHIFQQLHLVQQWRF